MDAPFKILNTPVLNHLYTKVKVIQFGTITNLFTTSYRLSVVTFALLSFSHNIASQTDRRQTDARLQHEARPLVQSAKNRK